MFRHTHDAKNVSSHSCPQYFLRQVDRLHTAVEGLAKSPTTQVEISADDSVSGAVNNDKNTRIVEANAAKQKANTALKAIMDE